MIWIVFIWLICGIVGTGMMYIRDYDESIDYTVANMMSDFICVFLGLITLLGVIVEYFDSHFSHVIIIKGKKKG